MSKNLLPHSIQALVFELAKLPGVGERSALRYALNLLRGGENRLRDLKKSLDLVEGEVSFCKECFFWTSQGTCPLCQDTDRIKSKVCVVRDGPDVLALERYRKHPWTYHVLQGLLSPLGGVGPSDIRLDSLFHRIQKHQITEVILALDSTVEGDATALFIREELKKAFPLLRVSRTAQGLPVGASVEYLDPSTLEHALQNRLDLE